MSSDLHKEANIQIEATTRLIEDGVEFEATRQVLHDWFSHHHGIIFTRTPGQWIWKYKVGANPKPFIKYNSFHELLEALFKEIDATA